jgi:hypothetical protein
MFLATSSADADGTLAVVDAGDLAVEVDTRAQADIVGFEVDDVDRADYTITWLTDDGGGGELVGGRITEDGVQRVTESSIERIIE